PARESENAMSWPEVTVKAVSNSDEVVFRSSSDGRSNTVTAASNIVRRRCMRHSGPQGASTTCHRFTSIRSILDLYKCITQLHRERTEQVPAVYLVACLARPFKRGGGGANASRTDCLRGALELVRGSGQLGKIASARGNANLPLRLNRCFAEFPQQRINGGAVLAEPSRKHVSVDRRGGLPLVWPIADAALSLDRQPALQGRAQALDAHRLNQIGVHAGCEAALFLALHSVGSDRNNRRADGAAVGFSVT